MKSRGSIIEVETALGIAHLLKYKPEDELRAPGDHLVNTFNQLTGLMG
ncbi:MAG TPA: hypothetical protein VFP87_14975 [Chitinophagaceae bacterium]|nr:hypothetical protein [Chitinophagaceae bacterium]